MPDEEARRGARLHGTFEKGAHLCQTGITRPAPKPQDALLGSFADGRAHRLRHLVVLLQPSTAKPQPASPKETPAGSDGTFMQTAAMDGIAEVEHGRSWPANATPAKRTREQPIESTVSCEFPLLEFVFRLARGMHGEHSR